MGWPVEPDVSDSGFAEASKWFRKKLAVPNAEWNALSDKARQRAFSVGGVTQLELVQDVWTAIDNAVAKGTTFKDFQAEVGDKLTAAWGGADAFRLQTIFRTNVQSALNAGRYEQQNDPDVIALRPYLKFSAILDGRTTQVCSSSSGTILPADHPWWALHQPPLHYNCRSTAISLTTDQMKDLGGVTDKPSDLQVLSGFGGPPSLEWAPAIGKYSPELVEVFLARTDVPPVPPAKKPEHTPEHWRDVYRGQGFGHEAAASLANGRAAQERGLDTPVGTVKKGLDVLSKDHAKIFEGHLDKLDLRGRLKKTLRELVDDQAVTGGDPLEQARLRALAALYGHASDLGDSKASTAMFKSAEDWTSRKTASARLVARRIVAQAVARVAPYLSSDAIPPEVQITWKTSRAYQAAGKVWLSAEEKRLAAATLEHEFGHAVEWASAVRLKASDQFLEKRAGADVPKQLRGLTGLNYGRTEYTHEDRFWDAYVGKVYGRRGSIHGSEVLSMGLQWFSDPAKVIAFFMADPEHFLFAVGQLASR